MAVPKIRLKGFDADWEKSNFGNFGSVAMCKRIFKVQTSPIGDIPFFKIGTFGLKPDAYITRELYNEYKSKYSFPSKGDILISAAGTIGRTIVYSGDDAYFQDSNIVWLNHNDQLNNAFLKYLYSIVNWASLEGATIKRLYNSNILQTEIVIPEYTEQEAISNYFQSLDLLIEATGKKIATLKQTKQASLQSMFPQEGETKPRVRFKGFTDEWKNIELSELFDFYKGRGLSKEKLNSKGQFNCILYGEIFTKYDFVVNDCISKTDIQEGFPSVCGDIIMPGSTTTSGIDLAKAVYVPFNEVLYGGDIIVLRPKIPKYINSFFIATLSSCINRENIAMVSQGTTIVHLHAHNIAGLIYLIPSVEEQAKIAEYFSNLDKQIFIQEQRLDKLKQIKSACLKNMFV